MGLCMSQTEEQLARVTASLVTREYSVEEQNIQLDSVHTLNYCSDAGS